MSTASEAAEETAVYLELNIQYVKSVYQTEVF